ncbi:TPA: HNH/ENDO VII family nuclease [Streptococcus suis]|uniref:HNH/ENDO VII family nuclease n=1 Tax=Streptococcus suis TaxID=1307 RepID=UPI000CF5CFDA|nr:HNH/ENDO VII family nuclease [Streptococcus suis]NQJ69938.1 hypothetical protein [Streptococcus suis]NQJ73311.1 hypothetical protein [Streptococcus suis]NRG69504.1 hypothetical protein [Streptococcus suis]HEL9636489.1 hypothetical protein [Streptococcus suis]
MLDELKIKDLKRSFDLKVHSILPKNVEIESAGSDVERSNLDSSEKKAVYSHEGLKTLPELLGRAFYPREVLKDIYNTHELRHYIDKGLKAKPFAIKENGEKRFVLTPETLDLDQIVDIKGKSNRDRLKEGKLPIKDGQVLEVHHIGQKNEGHYALLTFEEHRGRYTKQMLHKPGRSDVEHHSIFLRDKRAIIELLGREEVD